MKWLCILIGFPLTLFAQQLPDTSFVPPENKPAYAPLEGPNIYIDGGHGNFHTADNRFMPFAKLLAHDGYNIIAGSGELTKAKLKSIDVLVISNALHPDNQQNWVTPILEVFTEKEIQIISDWVATGGSLLLIADHMPFPGAVANLAAHFGFSFNNGFAMTDGRPWPPARFTLKEQSLRLHPIVEDQQYGLPVHHVATFTGQGFEIPSTATNLLEFSDQFYSLMPDTAWQFNSQTPKVNLKGWSQGAVMPYKKGRLAVFGEAAMFTAQIAGPRKTKVGFNAPEAPHNAQFVLNVVHWLDGLI